MKITPDYMTLGIDPETNVPHLLTAAALAHHLYVTGRTGVGKSFFLESLLRQFILRWPKHRSGMLIIDPHGSLVDNLLLWMAWNSLDRPVILIDLRRSDWIVGFNPLRVRAADPAVLVSELSGAIAHVWGAANTSETPRFARWISNILTALWERKLTLVQAEHLINYAGLEMRRALTENLTNGRARLDWALANNLRPVEFEEQLGSSINRLCPFLSTRLLRLMFGQRLASLDFQKVIEEGAIVLVSLATESGMIADEHARLVGTLLLTDLWNAAKYRGKRSGNKRMTVWLDEFQHFVTPTIAKSLDQARGFGLSLILSHQYPNQLLHAGPHGAEVLDSITANIGTKISFAVDGEENLRRLALSHFGPEISGDRIKHILYSTKVIGYEEQVRTIYGHSSCIGLSRTKAQGESGGAGIGGTELFNGDPPFLSFQNRPISISKSNSRFGARSSSETDGTSEAESHSESTVPFLMPILGEEISNIQFASIEEQVHAAMAAIQALPKRHFLVRLEGTKGPVMLRTPTISHPPRPTKLVEALLEKLYKRLPFCIRADKAESQLKDFEENLICELLQNQREVTSTRRRIK